VLTLAFDTTSSTLSTALLFNKEILTKNIIHESGKQSELLIPEIEKILKKNKIWYQDLDLIATSNGPGSFTGTRIGLTTARILKLATDLPLILVNSCEVIAFKYRNKSGKISVLLDAAMNEFFYAEFFAENEVVSEVSEPRLLRVENLSEAFPEEEFFLCGSGKNLINGTNFKCEIAEGNDGIEADLIGLLALKKFYAGKISENLNPVYLRAPRVTERKK
jgi:tRNA threonylcarbamoyladenosine biosynthesis protein TsaB